MNGRRLAVLLLAALALVAAGCGGDDGDEAAATTDSAIVDETETETTDDDSTTTDDDSIELEGECAQFAGLSVKLQQAISGSTGDLESATEVFDEIAEQVPEEIRDDYEVLAANFRELAEALQGVDLTSGEAPSPEVLQKLQEVSSKLDTPEARQATENIEAWARENC
jgi:hypothetical protein